MKKNSIPFIIRKSDGDDLNFIRKTWLESFKSDNCNHVIHNALYFAYYRDIVNNIIDNESIKLIAADESDPKNILSYVVVGLEDDKNILHYGFTKTWFRRFGLFWNLIDVAFQNTNPIYLTFCTGDFISIKKHQGDKLKKDQTNKYLAKWFWYNPFYLDRFKSKEIDYGREIDVGPTKRTEENFGEGI
jgi:hypothetical protein